MKSKRYMVDARWDKQESGYLGIYATPGSPITIVQEDGEDIIFADKSEAVAEAAQALVERMNTMTATVVNDGVARMTPVEFMAALADLDITVPQFAWLIGQKDTGIERWVTGEKPVPHTACLILHAMEDPDTREAMFEKTSALTKKEDS